jgi:hypothetical protein
VVRALPQSMPILDALYKKHGAAGFAVVGVNKDVTEATPAASCSR